MTPRLRHQHLAEHIAATRDADLLARFVAAAEIAGIDAPQQYAEANLGRLVSADVGAGSTVSTVYAYASSQYPKLRPGEDPAYVTDDQIKAALAAVQVGSSTPS